MFPDFNSAELIVKIIIIASIIIYILIDSLLRYFVWRLSTKEAKTLKKENIHIVFAIIIIVFKIAFFVFSLFTGTYEQGLSYIVELLLDLMDTILLVTIIVLTFKLRKLLHEREMVN